MTAMLKSGAMWSIPQKDKLRTQLPDEPASAQWNKADAINIGCDDSLIYNAGKAGLVLEKEFWQSVTGVVDALNSGRLVKDSGYCIVFSESSSSYYLMHRSDISHDEALAYARKLLKDEETGYDMSPEGPSSVSQQLPQESRRAPKMTYHSFAETAALRRYGQEVEQPAPVALPNLPFWSTQQCGIIGSESSGLKRVLNEKPHSCEVLCLGRTQWNSVGAAVTALNTGTLRAESGICIIFSNSGGGYHLMWRSDKAVDSQKLLASMAQELSEEGYSRVGDIADVRLQDKTVAGPWATSQCWLVDKDGCVLEHMIKTADEVLLVGGNCCASASEAVNKLNSGELNANGGLCVIYSKSSDSYYLLWRKDKDSIKFSLSFHHEVHMRQRAAHKHLTAFTQSLTPAATLLPAATLSPAATLLPAEVAPTRTNSVKGGFKRYEVCLSDQYHVMHEAIMCQFLTKLGLSSSTTSERLSQPGGRNLGVWGLHDRQTGRNLIAKRVSGEFNEGELFAKLARETPSIVDDPMLAFPVAALHEKRPNGSKAHDWIVMNAAPGSPLADVIGNLWYAGNSAKVMQVIEKTGACLAQFHSRYGNKQHCDFQPSNVIYDVRTDAMTFIDLADIGCTTVFGNDVDHMLNSLGIISSAYGPQFLAQSTSHFQAGYSRRKP